jgi:hypothetical protein
MRTYDEQTCHGKRLPAFFVFTRSCGGEALSELPSLSGVHR